MQKKKAPATPEPVLSQYDVDAYFIWVVTLLNVFDNFVPRPFTTVMIATEMPAAIRPYSMAVAPDSSLAKRVTRDFMGRFLLIHSGCLSTLRPGFCFARSGAVEITSHQLRLS